ncbi:PAS domain S-box protein [Nisaea nitritireducens]|uniref:PAS domain S-box protein n=1 Tax=Nisaea nitritireducens TaxID=568392 RepID=UPI001866A130|nr:PAS domain S-box protein [Nisaea nitritireducens]
MVSHESDTASRACNSGNDEGLMQKLKITSVAPGSSDADRMKALQQLSKALYWEWDSERKEFRFHAAEMLSIWKPELLPSGEIDASLVVPSDQPLLRRAFETIFNNAIPDPVTFEAQADEAACTVTYMLRAEPVHCDKPSIIRGIIKDISDNTLLVERARSAEEKLFDAIEALRDGFVIFDSDDRLVVCNQKYRDLYTRSAHVIKPGATFTEIVRAGLEAGEYSEAVGREEEWFKERLAIHQASNQDIEQQLGDGRWLRIAERKTADGMRIGLRIDITRLKQNEAKLKATLARLQQSELEARQLSVVVDRTRSMVTILDEDGRVEWVNPAFTESTGYTIEEIAGKEPRSFMRGPDTDKSVAESVDNDIEHGKSVSGTILHYKKNGTPIWVEFERQAIRASDGTVIQHMIVAHDVTEHVKATEVLAERAESIRAILDTVVDAIITIDSNGVILTFNPAAERMFGTRREEALGKNVSILMTGKHHANHPRYIASYLTGHTKNVIGKNREFTAIKSDGTVFPIELAVGEMFVGTSLRFVGIIRDISERKHLERIKREFISTVSHELKTPLTSITGALGLARSGVAGSLTDQMQQIIDIAYRNSERLGVLVTDILDIEKIDAGQMSYDMQQSDIEQLISDCVVSMQPYSIKFGVSLKICKTAENPIFTGDPNRMTQVITNLISNGIKFSKSGQQVEVRSESTADTLTFSVRDHGEGIPKELQERIFTRFFRVDSADDRHSSGTGLGLSICRPIAEAHGGTLSVESSPGAGSTFTVSLPRNVKA